MDFEVMFLGVVALLAFLIVVGTAIAVIIILRRPTSTKSEVEPDIDSSMGSGVSDPEAFAITQTTPTPTPTPYEDIQAYMAEQKEKLVEFELQDLSNSFQGTTNGGERQGVILHLTKPDTPLVAFAGRVSSQQNGAITAETAYGKMEVIIAQGRAGIQWDGTPIGILEFNKQRVLGPEGQLLGSMERPLPDSIGAGEIRTYPISFYGEKAADVNMTINALSALRWFGNEDADQSPAFDNLVSDLEDNQTLLLLGALVLEIGFFNVL